MQALKAAVIVMGLLILAAFGLVVYMLLGRIADGGGGDAFGTRDIDIPAGCELAAAVSDGERLVVRLAGLPERDCQQVILVDPASGEEIGRLRLTPRP